MTGIFPLYELTLRDAAVTLHKPFWAGSHHGDGDPKIAESDLYAASTGWSRIGNVSALKVKEEAIAYVLAIPDDASLNKFCASFYSGGHIDQSLVERYMATALGLHSSANEARKELFMDYLHHVRYMVGMLVNTSAIRKSSENDNHLLLQRLKQLNILAIGLDAETKGHSYMCEGPDGVGRANINIRDAIYKVSLLVPHMPGYKKYKVRVKGDDDSCVTSGPNAFEVVALKILENAIKYGITSGEIFMEIWRKDAEIISEFRSYGPELLPGEDRRIFDRGFRGQWASKLGGGFGIGLHLARTIVEEGFGGRITALQSKDNVIPINGVPYRHTTFRVVLPVK